MKSGGNSVADFQKFVEFGNQTLTKLNSRREWVKRGKWVRRLREGNRLGGEERLWQDEGRRMLEN